MFNIKIFTLKHSFHGLNEYVQKWINSKIEKFFEKQINSRKKNTINDKRQTSTRLSAEFFRFVLTLNNVQMMYAKPESTKAFKFNVDTTRTLYMQDCIICYCAVTL